MYPSIFYTLKCLIFSKLLKIANIGKKRYTKKFAKTKKAVPLYQILEILKAIQKAEMVFLYRFVCRLSLCYTKTAKGFNACTL